MEGTVEGLPKGKGKLALVEEGALVVGCPNVKSGNLKGGVLGAVEGDEVIAN